MTINSSFVKMRLYRVGKISSFSRLIRILSLCTCFVGISQFTGASTSKSSASSATLAFQTLQKVTFSSNLLINTLAIVSPRVSFIRYSVLLASYFLSSLGCLLSRRSFFSQVITTSNISRSGIARVSSSYLNVIISGERSCIAIASKGVPILSCLSCQGSVAF